MADRPARTVPRVWALLGQRPGDNAQVEALAEALGWPCERKELRWRRRAVGWTPFYGRMGPSLAPLAPEARGQFVPPWPDLVIAVGWRSVPVARWIARESGARLVHIGRPRAPLAAFDLVLTTPQYGLPEAPNVVRLLGPLTRLSPGRLAEAAEAWRGRLAHLPRPWTAVLVGGDAPPLRLTPEAAGRLGEAADRLARAEGGSLLVATSPRTGRAAAEALTARLGVPAHCFLWGEGDNPYAAYLALADAFIVTADSISMVHEASLTGRPLRLFPLPRRGAWGLRALAWLDRRLRAGSGGPARLYRHLVSGGWLYPPRDPEAFHAALVADGRAAWLDGPPPTPPPPGEAEPAAPAVAAVHALMGV
jgi:hypothetical protein